MAVQPDLVALQLANGSRVNRLRAEPLTALAPSLQCDARSAFKPDLSS